MKVNYGRLFVLGLGFMSISLTWAIYNSYVPIFLDEALPAMAFKGLAIGFIMTLDNIASITLQPFFSARSDSTWGRYGRRMPYLMAGIPLAAVAITLVPVLKQNIGLMLASIITMNVAMAVFRAPTVALMPDITPREQRSKANGVINLMGGLGGIIAHFIGSRLYNINPMVPFAMSGIVMLLALIILRASIKEPEKVEGIQGDEKPVSIFAALKEAFSPDKRSLLFLLLAIMFWFMGWNSVETFFTLYAKNIWGIRESTAALYLGIGSVAFLLFAIPSGFLASRYGRKAIITAGIIWMVCVMTIMTVLGITGKTGIGPAVIALLVAAGIGWALINIHSFPMVVDMTTSAKTGAYTGLYYFFSAMAAIIAPPLFGLVRDIVGSYQPLFPFSAVFFILALWSFSKVEAR